MATYINGNVVRKETVVTQPVKQHDKEQHNKSKQLNRGYVTFLAIASIVAMLACVQYLQLRSELAQRSQEITRKQRELVQLKEANTTKYNALINTMNLEEIRDIAVNDFGMVYADESQILTYSSPADKAMTQYADIPKNGIVAGSSMDR